VIAIIVVGVVLIVAGVVVMSITRWGWAWTGVVGYKTPQTFDNQEYVPGKTVWDLLELLIVPAALALTALWFSNRERKDDREIATDRQQESALQEYYDKISELLLKENLRKAKEGDDIISIARSRTLATLRSLDGVRKGMLIKFLVDAQLIDKQQTIINLQDADLSKVELVHANLSDTNLSGAIMISANLSYSYLCRTDMSDALLGDAFLFRADLSGANLINATLINANLVQANMIEANLYKACLENANLSMASLNRAMMNLANLHGAKMIWVNLDDAHLSMTNLVNANLSGASLNGTYLKGSNLIGANLRGANLREAKELSIRSLAMAKSLRGAIMMDNTIYNPAIHKEIARIRKKNFIRFFFKRSDD
jgi:uncharacterized protein YjbI with pentapeptide repeats